MEFLIVLWLPILLSAVGVFVASSVVHMALPVHKGDTLGLKNEAEVMAALRAGGVAPGEYMFPFCGDMKEMGSDEFRAKQQQGPIGFMTIVGFERMNIGMSLVQWFIYSILIGILVAYVGHVALPNGTGFATVFRVLGTVAVLPYGMSAAHDFIWRGQPFSVAMKFMIEGVVYGLLTGAIFAAFWPGL